MNLKELIEEYLKSARMLQVATSVDNQPWACTVFFAMDEALNLYWISKPSRRHSEEIRKNQKVAGTIVLPHIPGDKVRGVQFEGIAYELSDGDMASGLEVYSNRYNLGKDKIEKMVANSSDHKCYKITPTLFVLYDEVNFPDNPRQEYKV